MEALYAYVPGGVTKIRPKLVVLVGVLLLSAAGCARSAPSPPSATPSLPSASTPSPTGIAVSSTPASPAPTLAAEVVPWNPAGVRAVTQTAPAARSTPAPTNPPGCDGAELRLLPASARTAPTIEGWLTTFVLQFTGSSPCSMNPGYFGVTVTAADGATLPIDTMPTGAGSSSLMLIRPHQLVFGSIRWAVNPGRPHPHPTQLIFNIGDSPSAAQSISISVADVSIPPHPSSPSPQSAWGSTAYGLMTSAADPATLATLTAAVTAPATVRASSTLLYAVTVTNPTNTTVPLTGCPQFVEQLTVVPLKTAITVGARGPLNCAYLPPAVTANSSVTMKM
jgi:hypothetical protein